MVDLFLALALVGAVALWRLRVASGSSHRHRRDLDWLPKELHDAELVWSEKTFRCREPAPMVVRLDRAYRRPDGDLVLVEFKRRASCRAYSSDVVELSAQRAVVEQAGQTVSRRAYVVAILPAGTRCHAVPVRLENALQVARRAARLVALQDGRAAPSGPVHAAVCASCGHRDVCPRSPQ